MSRLSNAIVGQVNTLFRRYLTRETLMYLIFGILTSILSVIIFNLANKMGFNVALSNTISTVLAVIFAFVTNKLFVFKSKSLLLAVILPELIKFASGRAVMFLVETGLLILLVSYFGSHKLLAKIFTTVVVIIGNYFISKKAVFKEK